MDTLDGKGSSFLGTSGYSHFQIILRDTLRFKDGRSK